MYQLIDFPIETWILWGCAVVCLLYIIIIYCQRLGNIGRLKSQCENSAIDDEGETYPKVSIVIYARNESETLSQTLPVILQQQYPASYEVIVVNEGASEETSMVVGALRATHSNLYLTFTPDGARNLSRKKLALTLGIKAAHGDIVLITTADVKIPSSNWLKEMMQPFTNSNVSIVLGCGAIATPPVRLIGRLTRAFDLAADEIAWINGALNGKPYRCCGFNMAYRRQLFFDNKGFSRSLNLREGVDDIFLSEIAKDRIAKVVLTEDSLVGRDMLPYMRETLDYRMSHYFTGKKLRHSSQAIMAAGEWCLWGVILLSVGAWWIAGWTNWIALAATALLIIAAIVLVSIFWHKALKALATQHSVILLPFQALTRPLRNMATKCRSRLCHSHYTWTK